MWHVSDLPVGLDRDTVILHVCNVGVVSSRIASFGCAHAEFFSMAVFEPASFGLALSRFSEKLQKRDFRIQQLVIARVVVGLGYLDNHTDYSTETCIVRT